MKMEDKTFKIILKLQLNLRLSDNKKLYPIYIYIHIYFNFVNYIYDK